MVRKPFVNKHEVCGNVRAKTVPFNMRNVSLFGLHSESNGQMRLLLSPTDRALNISRYSANAPRDSADD